VAKNNNVSFAKEREVSKQMVESGCLDNSTPRCSEKDRVPKDRVPKNKDFKNLRGPRHY
jgi:hypothetical protein